MLVVHGNLVLSSSVLTFNRARRAGGAMSQHAGALHMHATKFATNNFAPVPRGAQAALGRQLRLVDVREWAAFGTSLSAAVGAVLGSHWSTQQRTLYLLHTSP